MMTGCAGGDGRGMGGDFVAEKDFFFSSFLRRGGVFFSCLSSFFILHFRHLILDFVLHCPLRLFFFLHPFLSVFLSLPFLKCYMNIAITNYVKLLLL